MLADGVAGLQWTAPSSWKNEGSRPTRAATYKVPPDAECIAYYFGQGQGGSVDANVQRWKGQFEPLKSADVKKKTVHGMPLTTLDLSGTYTGMGGPMMQSKSPEPNSRMLGAIVEGPQGSIFFKFTGPNKTVTANQAAFDKMVNSIAKK